ncbi:uncharacterized protein BKA55DRAFT_549463 [Fusarium redolens]|uniref:Uncharacterized protein n=1 Tax=Fusarium redolens TaxID=48865 RepID=A0A9P9KW72_FUSRE|nr:uncharacterized protein BKA55DRAFT_549463 [Fusarium redolens]KAH7269728.1 hypothetical protein BKA55DRAFT_549463 [Fusarium redolens]
MQPDSLFGALPWYGVDHQGLYEPALLVRVSTYQRGFVICSDTPIRTTRTVGTQKWEEQPNRL